MITSCIWLLMILTIPRRKQGILKPTVSAKGSIKPLSRSFYQVTFWKKLYGSLEELQKYLDEWLESYSNVRTHQGKMCYGSTP